MPEILKRIFEINLSDYDNIKINLEINKVVLGAFVALIVGVIILDLYRGKMRLTVNKLLRHKATTEENAKTLSELGLAHSGVIRSMLSKRNALTAVVARVGAVKYDYETYVKMTKEEREAAEKINFDEARFYIYPEKTHRAAFIVDRYNTSFARTFAECVFLAIVCGCIIACMPGILNVLNNLLGSAK